LHVNCNFFLKPNSDDGGDGGGGDGDDYDDFVIQLCFQLCISQHYISLLPASSFLVYAV